MGQSQESLNLERESTFDTFCVLFLLFRTTLSEVKQNIFWCQKSDFAKVKKPSLDPKNYGVPFHFLGYPRAYNAMECSVM